MAKRTILALALLAPALAGCTADRQPVCEPSHQPDNGTGVCFTTRDGWILQGVEHNPDAEGPSVLLLHGLNEQHGRYGDLIEPLAEDGYRVLAMDLRGHGDSVELTSGENRTVRSFSNVDLFRARADLNASQAYLGSAPTFVVGASVGANLALAHAADNPEIEGLVLLSPSMGQGPLSASEPNREFEGAIFYAASFEDRRATDAVEALSANHTGPHRVEIWENKGHGTQMLDAEAIDAITGWMGNRTASS